MPFANYRFTEEKGQRHYSRGHAVSLVGAKGILAEYLRSLEPLHRDQIQWELSGPDIARLACPDCENPDKELLLDLYPEGLVDVCLHRVEKIVGVSDDEWTDAVLVTRPIVSFKGSANANDFKRSFSVDLPFSARENMEAFGIKGGYEKGTYSWTQPKMNIGAAVCGRSENTATPSIDLTPRAKGSPCSTQAAQPDHVCTCGGH